MGIYISPVLVDTGMERMHGKLYQVLLEMYSFARTLPTDPCHRDDSWSLFVLALFFVVVSCGHHCSFCFLQCRSDHLVRVNITILFELALIHVL